MTEDDTQRAPAWRRYLRFWRTDPAADVRDELRFHLESAVREFIAAGLSPAAARAEAFRRFGDVDAVTRTLHTLSLDHDRTMHRRLRLDMLRQDLRIALRRLRRSPGFTALVVLTLAVGIGANAAIFSVVHAVLLRPLPYAHAGRLLNLRERNGAEDRTGMFVTFGNYGEWVSRTTSFEALGASLGTRGMTLTGAGTPLQVRVTPASASYWKALYITPRLGRYFLPDEDRPGAPPVVVLADGFWRSHFGGDSSLVGRAITLNGVPHTVVGIASPEYAFTPQAADAWVPLAIPAAAYADHGDHELTVTGLVREGLATDRALAELTGIEQSLARQYPGHYFDGAIVATSYLDWIVGPEQTLLLVLFGAVGLVLLIAAVNIANLLLARAAVRRREIAVRGALGAGQGQLVAHLLVESLVLAAGGAAAGLVVARAGTRFLVRYGPQNLARLHEATLNVPVVLFALGLALLCALVFGLLPALRAARLDLPLTLRDGTRSGSGAVRQRLRTALVVVQVSMTLVLLVGAGLLVRSAILLERVSPGFDPRNVFVGDLTLPSARYADAAGVVGTFTRIEHAAEQLPGVERAALVSRIPIGGFGADCGVRREGGPAAERSTFGANVRSATGSFFATLGIPLLRGRTFGPTDGAGAIPVAIINRRLATELFGGADPVGRRVACGGAAGSEPTWRVVVGVTGDVHASGLAEDIRDELYVPQAQLPQRTMRLLVRGTVPVTTLVPALRRAVAAVDPELPVAVPRTMEDVIARTLATPRFQSSLLALLGGVGLLLAVVGIYGVIAFLVTQRAHEIGVRIALGARRRQVLVLIVRQGVGLALVGVTIGTALSLLATRVLSDLVFGIDTRDPLTIAGVAVLLTVVSAVASLVPALRATRVDPLATIRSG